MQIGDACKQQSTEKAVFLEADYWGGPLKSCRWQGKCLALGLATLPSHSTQSLTIEGAWLTQKGALFRKGVRRGRWRWR